MNKKHSSLRFTDWIVSAVVMGAYCLTLASIVTAPAQAAEPDSEPQSPMHPEIEYADNKVRFNWDDKVTLAAGALVQGDWGYIQNDAPVTPEGWDAQLRRGRIEGSGVIMGRVAYMGQYDFVGDNGRAGELETKYKDVYIEILDIPFLGDLRMGHFKEPYSLQFLTDAGDRIFMEEALSVTFTPGRNTGAMFSNAFFNERMTVAIGAFSNVTNESNFWGAKGQANLTGRLTGLPWYKEDGRKLFHIGISATQQWRNDDDSVRYQQKPEYNMANIIGDTGAIASESQVAGLGEFALNYNSLSAQIELSFAYQNTPGPLNNHFKAAYVQVSYLLTGEFRPYDTRRGVFGRLEPANPIGWGKRGWGAWEVALRASYLDYHDYEVRGGYMNEIGVALNWYLTSNLRLNVNYLHHHLNSVGSSNIFGMRAQVYF